MNCQRRRRHMVFSRQEQLEPMLTYFQLEQISVAFESNHSSYKHFPIYRMTSHISNCC